MTILCLTTNIYLSNRGLTEEARRRIVEFAEALLYISNSKGNIVDLVIKDKKTP